MRPDRDRRAEDRSAWPRRDRARWWLDRIFREIRDRIVALFVILLLALIGLNVAQQVRSDARQDRAQGRQDLADRRAREAARVALDRDEVRKYQVCVQRVAGDTAANLTNEILRGAVLRTRTLRLEQARRATDPVLRRAFLRSARGYLRDSRRLKQADVTDCERTYPRGMKLAPAFPDLAPVQQHRAPTTK